MTAEIHFLNSWRGHRATWMPDPDSWRWKAPDGGLQGFGWCWRDMVGLANLTWLAMDLITPPLTYDLNGNMLANLLWRDGRTMLLDNLPLYEQAEALTLAQFRNLCTRDKLYSPRKINVAPVLYLLASQRLEHAHT